MSAALNTDAVLADDRFDFSNTYFLLTGCAGSAEGYGKSESKIMSYLMSCCLLNFMGRPHFIAYEITDMPITVKAAIKMGAKNVCWTSKNAANEEGRDTVIFER